MGASRVHFDTNQRRCTVRAVYFDRFEGTSTGGVGVCQKHDYKQGLQQPLLDPCHFRYREADRKMADSSKKTGKIDNQYCNKHHNQRQLYAHMLIMSITGFSGLLSAHVLDVFYHIKDYKQQKESTTRKLSLIRGAKKHRAFSIPSAEPRCYTKLRGTCTM